MNYDPQNDPLLEPEETSTSNFVLIPEGRHSGVIMAWEVDTEFESKNGNRGWKFELEVNFPQHDTQQRAWLDTSSNWGKQQVQAMLAAAQVPFEIPDRENLNSKGKPRKSYYKSLIKEHNEITGIYTFNEEALNNKEVSWKIVHKIKCNECRWMVAKNLTTCANPACRAGLAGCKIYATIDTTEILPLTKNSDLVNDINASIDQEKNKQENKGVPDWVTVKKESE